jgi:predicted DNA binding CopG/RHH family protein
MRGSVHDSRIFLRANDALIAEAKAKADREGMTLSELVRQAVRREVREAA